MLYQDTSSPRRPEKPSTVRVEQVRQQNILVMNNQTPIELSGEEQLTSVRTAKSSALYVNTTPRYNQKPPMPTGKLTPKEFYHDEHFTKPPKKVKRFTEEQRHIVIAENYQATDPQVLSMSSIDRDATIPQSDGTYPHPIKNDSTLSEMDTSQISSKRASSKLKRLYKMQKEHGRLL